MPEIIIYETDPLYARECSDSDEFYNEHLEEFECYEDAEDYYCNHHEEH